ncbi:MAG: hypothetical protein VKK04_19290 [Synechococcales bacterium]|nr:hypothetical protein [Synechococcales bacterium]
MNALQPSPSPTKKSQLGRSSSRRQPTARRQRRQRHHQAVAAEAIAMTVVNLILAIAALSALVRLLPASITQQAKLQELEGEAKVLEDRVNKQRQIFNQYFDPQQTQSNMRELSNRIETGEQQIILIDPSESDVN